MMRMWHGALGEGAAPVLQPPSTRGRSHYVMFFDTQAAVDALLGKTLILTTVSGQGSCESTWLVK